MGAASYVQVATTLQERETKMIKATDEIRILANTLTEKEAEDLLDLISFSAPQIVNPEMLEENRQKRWDEYEVEIQRIEYQRAVIKVRAMTEEQAGEIALETVSSDDYECMNADEDVRSCRLVQKAVQPAEIVDSDAEVVQPVVCHEGYYLNAEEAVQ